MDRQNVEVNFSCRVKNQTCNNTLMMNCLAIWEIRRLKLCYHFVSVVESCQSVVVVMANCELQMSTMQGCGVKSLPSSTRYSPQKIAILLCHNFSQVVANSSVDRKITKLGSYRKISAKYTVLRQFLELHFCCLRITTI